MLESKDRLCSWGLLWYLHGTPLCEHLSRRRVGLVLVDPIHPSEWLEMTEVGARKLAGAIWLSRYGALLARLGVARLISALVRLGAPGLGRTSLSLLTSGTIAEAARMIAPFAKLPIELRPIVAALWTQPKFFDAIVGQAEALPQSAAQVATLCGLYCLGHSSRGFLGSFTLA
jgi:hypothetical protein